MAVQLSAGQPRNLRELQHPFILMTSDDPQSLASLITQCPGSPVVFCQPCLSPPRHPAPPKNRERQMRRQTDRQTDRNRDTETQRQRHRNRNTETESQSERQAEQRQRQRDRQRRKQRETETEINLNMHRLNHQLMQSYVMLARHMFNIRSIAIC